MSNQFDNKKFVTLYFTSKQCRLRHTDLLVYCYRVHQDSFDTEPTFRRIAKATGLKEETVSAASIRLVEMGLLSPDCTVLRPCPHLGWFQRADKLVEKFGNQHFSKWFRNWRCFVRQPGPQNPLTVASVMVYSVIHNSVTNGWKPLEGWSHEYLSLITRLSAKTVAEALTTLESLGFLRIYDGMRFGVYQKVQEGLLDYFADKRVYSGHASVEPDEFIDGCAPISVAVDGRLTARRNLAEYMNRWEIGGKAKDKIVQAVISMPDFPNNWQDKAYELVGKIMDMEDGRC